MKYKIKLGGRGADIWVHDINEEQKKLLKEGNVTADKMEMDDIAKILNVNMVDESDNVYTGVYDEQDAIVIEVRDESGNVIFDSTEEDEWYFDYETLMDYDNSEFVHEGDNKFIVESYSKGNFFEFELECEEFDPIKLSPQLVEINERFQLITGLFYEGKELEKEFDDYWGKGYYYHLG
jgi:hypothetical protein